LFFGAAAALNAAKRCSGSCELVLLPLLLKKLVLNSCNLFSFSI